MKINKYATKNILNRLKKTQIYIEIFFLKATLGFLCLFISFVYSIVIPSYRKIVSFMRDYKVVLDFLKVIFSLPIVLLIIWVFVSERENSIEYINYNNINTLVNIIIFLIYVKVICSLLKDGRRFSLTDKSGVKYVYLLFAFFYCLMICMSFAKDIIATYYMDKFPNIDILSTNKINANQWLQIAWGALNSLKEAILAAIIFDAVYQFYNYNLTSSQKEYLTKLTLEGRLYILPEDRNMEVPRIWMIRGDACEDIVDHCKKYRFIRYLNYEIKYTDNQATQIIDKRKNLFYDDSNSCMYSEDTDKPEYYFSFSLLDFSDSYSLESNKKNLIDMIRDKLIELPEGLIIKQNSLKVILNKLISKIEKRIKKIRESKLYKHQK